MMKEKKNSYLPVKMNNEEELEDVITCSHHFLPIDSTGEIFACSKCGYLTTKKKLYKKRKKKKNKNKI